MTLAILGGTPIGSTKCHRTWPVYDDDDRAAVSRAMRRTPFGANGPAIREAEEEIAEHFGARHALLVNSATDGLTAAQIAVGVGRDDEVIQPAYSFSATPHSTRAAGARPVFADIRRDTFTIDPARVREAITDRTRAILPVSIHGLIVDVAQIQKIADKHGLPVIWDNAQSAGGTHETFTAGTTGAVRVISLNYKKILAADQGGIVLTDDPEIDRALRRYAHYGTGPLRGPLPSYWTEHHGVNLAPPNATAALAVSRLRHLSGHVATAQRNMAALLHGLRDIPGLLLPYVPPDTVTTWSRPRLAFDPGALGWKDESRDLRDRVITALRGEGLPVRSWQEWPLPAHPAWRGDVPPRDYRRTAAMLEESFMLADDPWPLWCQDVDVVTDHYVPAFRKVWGEMDAVMEADFPVVLRPAPWPEGM